MITCKHKIPVSATLLGLLLLSSCVVGKKYQRPELHLPETIIANQTDSATFADTEWWEVYTDTTLVSLITKTLKNNKDMLVAAARIREMAALKRMSSADLYPKIGADVSYQREIENYGGSNPDATNTAEAKLGLTWELDLWGNLRWGRKKGVAEYLQSVEGQRAVQMTLIAEVAQAYFELTALDNELSIVRQTLSTRHEGVRQARLRFEGGLTSETSYQQAQVELAKTATLVPELEREISMKENQIALLAGEYPYRVRRTEALQTIDLPKQLPVGLPSTLLKRRPDLRVAEQKLIAANAAVGIAYTDMFPRVSFSGIYGLELENGSFANFIRSPYTFLAGQLLGPIFNGGKLRAKYRAQQAAFEQECYRYQKSVLTAFQEVNNAIVAYNKAREAYRLKLVLERAAKSYVDLARLQYINGVINYLDVLDAQRGYFDAQIGLSNAVRDEQIALVNLYKALGGGWDTDDPALPAKRQKKQK